MVEAKFKLQPFGGFYFRLNLHRVKRMKIYSDDVFIVTPPKSGTTWTQEIVWMLRNGVDLEKAKVNQVGKILCSFLRQT